MSSTSHPASTGAVAARGEAVAVARRHLGDAHESRDADEPELNGPAGTGGIAVTLGEVVSLLGVITIAAVGTWSLGLAQLGRHDGVLALVLGLITAGIIAAGVRAIGGGIQVRLDPVELALIAAIVVAGAFFFLPGFHYAYADKDPGVYVAHGFAIAREGDVAIDDLVVQRNVSPEFDFAGRFPGIWPDPDEPGKATSQFYHFYPSLLATAHDLGGDRALFNLNSLLAIGAVVVLVLATRRVAGTATAAVAGALLVTSMIQVWQARYPSTEITAQLLLAGALMAAVLAIDRRWTGAALVAGVALGTGFLARPDGFLYILIACAFVALATALGWIDRRAWALAAGLAVTLPYSLWNAYVARADYSESNSVPDLAVLVAVGLLVLAAGELTRRGLGVLGSRFPRSILAHPTELPRRWQVRVGLGVSMAVGVALFVLFFREQLLGVDYAWSTFAGDVTRSLDERTLPWLSWFVSLRGLVLMWLGVCVIAVRRWQAPLFVLVAPGALLLFVYLWDARVSMRLMWFVRRFAPAVLPAMIILIAVAIGWALSRRSVIVKIAAAAIAVTLVAEYAAMSLPLRDHDEMAGSWDLSAAISAQAGDQQGVFLFPPGQGIYDIMRNAPASVWFIFDQIAARLPADYDMAEIEKYEEAFSDRPVFLVERGDHLPEMLPSSRFTKTGTVTGEIVIWEETQDRRPAEDVVMPAGASVWRLRPAADAG